MFTEPASANFDLDRIDVAKHCPALWEAMSGDDRVRNCSQCDRMVYNIAGLSRREASDLIANRGSRLCIRLHRRADGTVMTNDCPKGLRAYRLRVAKCAGSVLAAILGLFTVGQAQRQPGGDSQGTRSESSVNVARIEGIVRDPAGAVIPNATVTVTTANGKTLQRKTDRRGRFSLTSFALERGLNKLRIEAPHFYPFQDEFTIRRRETIDYPVILEVGTFIGVVVVRSEPLIDPKKSSNSTTIRIND
ncbi:MAG TPA: carboxypeptidase-like regulatory domain-containing protein [Pyrinomonadaceae bacterium]|nr:carboxypeptidase-like regulatory domain-containing protein [Pyrinomonadaceae bacterium]